MTDKDNRKSPEVDEKMEQVHLGETDTKLKGQPTHLSDDIHVKKGDNRDLTSNRQRRLRLTALVILTFGVERIGYYGVLVNLALYSSTHVGFGDLDAVTIFSVYMGFNLIFSFVVGLFSDLFIGTYRTVVLSFYLYMLGALLLPFSDMSSEDWTGLALSEDARKAVFLSSLVLIAVGSGGFLATILPFGAHHIQALGQEATSSFYMWAYWAQNAPQILTFSVVAYLQQSVSFFWGYILVLCSTVVAFLIFLAGKNYYMKPKVEGTAIKLFFSVLKEGMCGRKGASERGGATRGGFLDKARSSCGGRHSDKIVDDVKDLLKVIPLVFLMILFWCLFYQYGTTFVSQAVRMDLGIGQFQFPASSLVVVNAIFVILVLPVVNRHLIPYMEKTKYPLTPFRRMAIGMVFLALGMVSAGVVELYRKEQMEEPGCSFQQEVSDRNFTASCVSVFLQVPQYCLYAVSEIFTVTASQELSFLEAPESMKSLVSGMIIAAMGLGGFGASAIARIVTLATKGHNAWLGDEINEVKMENFFFLLAGLMGVNLLVLMLFAHFYKYRQHRGQPRSRSQSVWTLENFSYIARLSFSDQAADNIAFTEDDEVIENGQVLY